MRYYAPVVQRLLDLLCFPCVCVCVPSRGLHGGPEDLGPDPGPVRVRVYILKGQPGPNLLLRVPGLINIECNTRVNRRTPHPPEISVSQHACV